MRRWISGWVVLMVLAQAAAAQSTLDERIKSAHDAQAAREAESRKKELAANAAATAPPPGAPRVDISGVRPRQVPGPVGAGAGPIAERIELVQIRGFTDEPASLEALVYVNGNRYAITAQQRRIPGGWELVAITPDAVEIAKGSERRQLRFVQYFQPAGPADAAQARR